MGRDSHQTRPVGNRPLHCLADPPGGVGRKLEAPSVVELLDRPHQPQVPLLDQVQKRQASALVPLGHRHHQPEVALRHAPSSRRRARLDLLGQLDFVGSGQQPEAADLPKVRPKRVVQVAGLVVRHLGCFGLFALPGDVLCKGLVLLLVAKKARNTLGLGRVGSRLQFICGRDHLIRSSND